MCVGSRRLPSARNSLFDDADDDDADDNADNAVFFDTSFLFRDAIPGSEKTRQRRRVEKIENIWNTRSLNRLTGIQSIQTQ